MDVFLDVNICPSSRMGVQISFLAVKKKYKDHLYKILYTYVALFLKQLQNGVVVQNACY